MCVHTDSMLAPPLILFRLIRLVSAPHTTCRRMLPSHCAAAVVYMPRGVRVPVRADLLVSHVKHTGEMHKRVPVCAEDEGGQRCLPTHPDATVGDTFCLP